MDHSEVRHLPKVDHTPAELDEASRVLLKSADYMEVNGKSEYRGPGKAMCAMFTIEHVSGVRRSEAYSRFRRHCEALGFEDVSHFNRQHEAGRIVSALRAVALGLSG